MLYNMQYEYIIYSLTAILVTYTQQTFILMQQNKPNCVYLYNYRMLFFYTKLVFFPFTKKTALCMYVYYVCISYRLVKVFKRLAASYTGPFSSATSVADTNPHLFDSRIRILISFRKMQNRI